MPDGGTRLPAPCVKEGAEAVRRGVQEVRAPLASALEAPATYWSAALVSPNASEVVCGAWEAHQPAAIMVEDSTSGCTEEATQQANGDGTGSGRSSLGKRNEDSVAPTTHADGAALVSQELLTAPGEGELALRSAVVTSFATLLARIRAKELARGAEALPEGQPEAKRHRKEP
jgi:hypothetical protein